MSGQSIYKFKDRAEHSAPVIGESLYLWAGSQLDLPEVHDSPQKRKLTSTVETFSFSSARWSSHLTRGTPPLGVIDYSCTTFRFNIYYYAGWCGHDDCYHNSLNVLNTLTMSWTQLHPNDESMMKKCYGGMLSLEFDGTDYLFMVGGLGTTPAVKHPQFQYDQIKDDGRVVTNEQLLYNLSNGQFTVPSVSGQYCPPTSNFTINKINQNKGIMFGGIVTIDDGLATPTNNVYIFNVTHNTIHWESIKKGSISGEGLWTKERYNHASAIINGDSTSPALVVIGGRNNNNQLVNDCLLFDKITTGQFSCKQIPLPESVTGRYLHSLTAVTMSPHCVWLVIVGGCEEIEWEDVGGGVKQAMYTPITDTNRLTMIIELEYIEAGEWIVQSVLDGNDLTSKKYQEKYSSYSKTRTWWMDQLIEYPTEKEMKLQRYIQSLHEELQVAHQNKVSLQEALTEANKQVDDSETVKIEKLEEVLKAQAQLQEEKQIITEDNEKMKAKVDDYEVYITEIEEEKKKVEKERMKAEPAEEQYLKEKQITKELKTKVADNELYTAKLMKERKQWSQVKETSTIRLQFNYLEKQQEEKCISLKKLHKENRHITSFSRDYCILLIYLLFISFISCTYYNSKNVFGPLPGVKIIASTNLLVAGGSHTQLHWEEYGLILDVPPDALPRGFIAKITVRVSVSGPYIYPDSDTWKPASAVYWISSSKDFVNPVLLGIQHSLRGNVKSSEIKVLTADDGAIQNMSYMFQNLYSNFTLNGPYVYLLLNHFSATTLVANNLTEISFYGALYCKKTRGKYYWDYSYLVYQSFPTNITNKILADYKTYWTCVTEETDVIFEDNSTAITLNLPSNQNWDITGKTSPLIYYKDYIKRDRIQSNMQFMLLWKGQGHPTIEPVVLHLSGTVQPNTVLIVTNLIEDEDRNHVHVVHTEKQLDATNLNQIISALKDSKYEVGTWHSLCLSLGLFEGTLKAIEADEKDSDDRLRTCLNKWLKRVDGVDDTGGPTWTSLKKALNNIDQKAVAESLKNN